MKSKLLSFSIALLASFCLWIYVVTVVNQVVTNPISDVAVTFAGEDQIREDSKLIITEGADTTLNLKVTCKRAVFSKLTSAPDSVSVVVDVSRIKKPGEYTMPFTVVYPNGVSNSEVNAQAIGVPHQTITFTVERYTSKTIQVKGVLSGSVSEGYYAPAPECSPKEVVIEGPESAVNAVNYAQVILEQENLTETVTQALPITLIDENGDPVESGHITVMANGIAVDTVETTQLVLKMKEIPLTVGFTPGGGVTADDVIWSVTPATLTIAGEQEVLDRINALELATFDLAELVEPYTGNLPVVLMDDVVGVAAPGTAQVNINIDSNKVAAKTLRVTRFSVVNEPEDLLAEVMSLQLVVTVRGPTDAINRITANDVRAVVDVSGLKEGSQSVPAAIEITGFDEVGALGDYSVSVKLERE